MGMGILFLFGADAPSAGLYDADVYRNRDVKYQPIPASHVLLLSIHRRCRSTVQIAPEAAPMRPGIIDRQRRAIAAHRQLQRSNSLVEIKSLALAAKILLFRNSRPTWSSQICDGT